MITAGVAADVSRRLDNGRTKGEEDQPRSHEAQLRTERAIAEMVATLYDESLDAFVQPHWQRQFHIFRQDYSNANAAFENNAKAFQWMYGRWAEFRLPVELIYRSFPSDLVANVWSFGMQARTMARTGLRAQGASADGMARTASLSLGSRVALEQALPRARHRRDLGRIQAAKRAAPGQEVGRFDAAQASGPDLSKSPPERTSTRPRSSSAIDFGHQRRRETGIHHAGSADPMEVLGFAHDKNLRSA